jgi:hypothetical protein
MAALSDRVRAGSVRKKNEKPRKRKSHRILQLIIAKLRRRYSLMAKKKDEEREERITNEIIVDAYGPEELAMGWYYHLEPHRCP